MLKAISVAVHLSLRCLSSVTRSMTRTRTGFVKPVDDVICCVQGPTAQRSRERGPGRWAQMCCTSFCCRLSSHEDDSRVLSKLSGSHQARGERTARRSRSQRPTWSTRPHPSARSAWIPRAAGERGTEGVCPKERKSTCVYSSSELIRFSTNPKPLSLFTGK